MANRYWVNGGTGNWSSTTNWSATSGGASGASVPGSADDVFFDNLGNSNSSVNSNFIVLSVNVSSGYTSTLNITSNFTLTVTVNIILGASMTIAGTGFLVLGSQTNASITSNGVVIPNFRITHQSTGTPLTFTLNDVITCSGNLEIGNGNNNQNCTINGNSINATGNISILGNNASLSRTNGTTVLNINGTGNQTLLSNSGVLHLGTNINKASGTLTIGSVSFPLFRFGGNKTLTYITGAVSVFTNTFLDIYESAILNTAGISWENVRPQTSGTITFTSAFTLVKDWVNNATQVLSGAGFFTTIGGVLNGNGVNNSLTLCNNLTCNGVTTSNATTLNGFTINNTGNLTVGSTLVGTSIMNLTGTGTWSGAGTVTCNLTFNTAGTITVGNVTYGTQNSTAGNLTYTTGSVITTSGTLTIVGGTWNTSGMIWSNLFCNSNNTLINLVSDINCVNLQINNVTFTPSGGNNINISGDLNLSNQSTVGLQSSTTNYRMVGTGTISANHTIGRIAAPLVFNTLGTITLSGTIGYSNSTFTHTSGTVNAGASTFILGQATNFVINNTGFALNNLNPSTFSVTFSGTNGCTINNFSSGVVTAGVTHTFQSLRTYNIATLEVAATFSSPATIRSSTPSSQAIVTLTNASYNYSLNVTDINSGLGAVGFTSGGILTNATNWTTASAALYYIGSTNYSGANLWSVISGGSPISAITAPTSSDPVIFDANSGNCIMNVAGVAGSVNFTNYTNTITFSNNLSVSGNITLGSGMTFAGAGALSYVGTTNSTLTSNAKEVGVVFGFGCGANHTITFADNWTFGENLILQSGTSAVTMIYNGNNLLCKKSLLTNNSSGRNLYGTTKIQMIGSGDIGTVIANLNFGLDLEINTIGSYTIQNLTWGYLGGRTLKYTTGTVTHATGTTLTLGINTSATNTLDLNGIDFQTISIGGGSSPIYNLSSNLKCATLIMNSGTNLQLNNNTIYVTNLSVNGNNSGLYGTTLIYFNGWNGNGTWSGAGNLQLSVTIDTPNLLTVNDGVILQRGGVGTTFFTVTQQSQVVFNGTFVFSGITPNAIEVTTPSNFMFNTLLVERATVLNLNNPIFCNDFTHNPATTNWFASINNNSLTVMRNFIHYSANSGLGGNGKIIIGGTGILQAGTNTTGGDNSIEFEINTSGVITITPNNTQRYIGIFKHIKGTIIANKSTFQFNSGATVLGASRMNLDNVQIAGGGTITMDEFFSGTPQIPTKVVSSTTVNYTINFTDGFEKLAKNVRVSRCTIGKRGQLLLLSKGGFGVNNLGIRYYNQLPNGVSTDTQKFVNNNLAGMPPLRAVNMLVGDPAFT